MNFAPAAGNPTNEVASRLLHAKARPGTVDRSGSMRRNARPSGSGPHPLAMSNALPGSGIRSSVSPRTDLVLPQCAGRRES
jgi:hypothetical protein